MVDKGKRSCALSTPTMCTMHIYKVMRIRGTHSDVLCWTSSTTLRDTGPGGPFLKWCCTGPPHLLASCLDNTTVNRHIYLSQWPGERTAHDHGWPCPSLSTLLLQVILFPLAGDLVLSLVVLANQVPFLYYKRKGH